MILKLHPLADGQNINRGSSATVPPPASNTDKYTGGFGGPPGLLRPQNAGKPNIYVAGIDHDSRAHPKTGAASANPGRYTGGFNAPSGILSPQNAPRPFQQAQPSQEPQTSRAHAQSSGAGAGAGAGTVATAASSHHQSRFGGPPGILVPFDNAQRGQ